MELKKTRDLYIDTIKGIAALSVVNIHIVFWSGGGYIPSYMRDIALFLDVPIFIYLAGLLSKQDISRTIKSLTKLWISYSIFMLWILVLASLVVEFNPDESKSFLMTIFKFGGSTSGFPLVKGSIWYMSMYFPVVLIGAICTQYLSVRQLMILALVFVGILGLDLFKLIKLDGIKINLVYVFIYLLGVLAKNIKIKKVYLMILLFSIVAFLSLYHFNIKSIFPMQGYKFPPHLVYLCYSLLSIMIIEIFRNKVKIGNNILAYIGKRALFFYFAQMISSSLIFYYIDQLLRLIDNWVVVYLVVLVITLILTFVIAKIIEYVDKQAWKGLYYIKNITK